MNWTKKVFWDETRFGSISQELFPFVDDSLIILDNKFSLLDSVFIFSVIFLIFYSIPRGIVDYLVIVMFWRGVIFYCYFYFYYLSIIFILFLF